MAVAVVAGAFLGSIAATSSKAVDELIMRLLDVIMAFPTIALAAVLLAAFGNSVPTIIVAIAIIYTPQLARVVRANVLAQYGEDYVGRNGSSARAASTSWPSTSCATLRPPSWCSPR